MMNDGVDVVSGVSVSVLVLCLLGFVCYRTRDGELRLVCTYVVR